MRISQTLLDTVIEHCRRGYPDEACGIVTGFSGKARRVYCLTNVAPDKSRRYLIDAREQFRVFREMREAGEELVAIFHSHPATAAYPSQTDVDLAFYPQAAYVIVSLAGSRPDVRAYRIDRERRSVVPVAVIVESESPDVRKDEHSRRTEPGGY
ncbi:MAG: M67 family metallopeptidase [Firmicutes bacterium]|nr:M67 family metallopeptidase [Bacillota bacterium]